MTRRDDGEKQDRAHPVARIRVTRYAKFHPSESRRCVTVTRIVTGIQRPNEETMAVIERLAKAGKL